MSAGFCFKFDSGPLSLWGEVALRGLDFWDHY